MIGEVVGNYRIVAELGRGGMGMVYRAEHVSLGRPAALKVLLPQMSMDPAIVQRFFNEARAASAIDHPGIVEIYDFGTHHDGRAFIVMALLRGESLETRVRRERIDPLEGATIVAQVAGALAAAHVRGIVHRDLKPDNIFLVPNELMPYGTQVKLLDFGIAKLAGEPTGNFKTQTGALIGTPAYMSPEQCMGRPEIDHRTDLYSLGCILFHVTTGRPPFVSDLGTGVMIAAHMRDPVPPPRSLNPNVPEPLAAIAMRLLEKDPAARYQSAMELRNALALAGATAPVTKPPAGAIDQYGATVVGPTPSRASDRGQAAYAPTSAALPQSPTTTGGSAAQVMAPPAAVKKSRGVWIGVGALALVGAAVAITIAAMQGSHDDTTAPSPPSPVAHAPEVKSPEVKTPAAPPVPAAPAASAAAACGDGKVSSDDTHGNCCWRDQAWSTAKQRCIGAPTCPSGMIVKGEECVEAKPSAPATAALVPKAPVPVEEPAHGATVPPTTFKLDAASFPAGASVRVHFPQPVASPSTKRAWITIVEAKKPPSSYGAWKFVPDGAVVATLDAPQQPGEYEMRLHTDYPTKSFNVRHRVAFTVSEPTTSGATPLAQQQFTLATSTVAPGSRVELRFSVPLRAVPGEKFWATVVKGSSSDATWAAYEYVPDGATSILLPVPSVQGDYEVRLHANYPRLTTHVVHRESLHVE